MDAIQAFSLKLSIITDVIQYTGPWSLLLALAGNLRLTSPGAFRQTWQGIFLSERLVLATWYKSDCTCTSTQCTWYRSIHLAIWQIVSGILSTDPSTIFQKVSMQFQYLRPEADVADLEQELIETIQFGQ